MAGRKAISKKLRFDVFKRDGFKCQYCGAEAPKAVLHVDHINPVANGGTNELLNLVTSCEDCNSGKGARLLSDDSAVAKQRAQLDELHERREQMEMMLEWRDSMKSIGDDETKAAQEYFSNAAQGWSIKSDGATKALRALLKKHGLLRVMDAIDLSVERYAKTDDDGRITPESVQQVWNKVGGILRINSLEPDKKRLYYIKGILNNRLSYVPYTVLNELEQALDGGVDVEDMELEAKHTRSWSSFSAWLRARS